jgi:putative phosphoribosyl transferase
MPTNLDFEQDYIFIGRQDATIALFNILPQKIMQDENWLILCLSSGAVSMAEYVAHRLGIDYDILLVTPIFAPNNDECQVAMISESQEIVVHSNLVDSFEIDLDLVYEMAKDEYEEKILDFKETYRKSLPLSDIKDRAVLLIDEGCETGLSTVCALKTVIELGVKKVSLATPLIAEDLYENLDMKVDKVYTNKKIRDFIDVEYYYASLEEPQEKEIKKILKNSRNYLPYKGAK